MAPALDALISYHNTSFDANGEKNMPFDGNGNHSLPQGSIVETGDKVLPSQHNPPLQDISAALSMVLIRDGRAPMVGSLPMNGNPITGLAPGTNPTDAATVSQGVPVGALMDFAGSVAPSGWMLCYGQSVSRTTYAALFTAIGTTYGAGDGSTTFNLPDVRGRVTAGRDDMGGTVAGRLTGGLPQGIAGRTLGAGGGLESHVNTISEMAPHNHGGATLGGGAHLHTFLDSLLVLGDGVGTGSQFNNGTTIGTTSSAPDHTHVIAFQGNGAPHNNVQPTIITNKIIKVSV